MFKQSSFFPLVAYNFYLKKMSSCGENRKIQARHCSFILGGGGSWELHNQGYHGNIELREIRKEESDKYLHLQQELLANIPFFCSSIDLKCLFLQCLLVTYIFVSQ